MDSVALILDIGLSMQHPTPTGASHLDQCKNIISVFLQRKIFSKSTDQVCLFTFGSTDTANELAEAEEYQNISMDSPLKPANWDLCNHVQNHITATDINGDFIDALIVGSTYLIKETSSPSDPKLKKKLASGRKILMLLSSLGGAVKADYSEIKNITAGFKDSGLELHVIGVSLEEEENDGDGSDEPSTSDGRRPPRDNGQTKPKTASQLKGEAVIGSMLKELEGCAYEYREAMAAMTVFGTKQKNSMAWNTELTIGADLKIPISAFKLVTRESLPTFKRCAAADKSQDIDKKVDTFLADETETMVTSDDIIKGYRYGTDLVPFTDDDMKNMKYTGGEKSLSLIGFANSTGVPLHWRAGTDSMLVTAQKADPVAGRALSALIRALFETDKIAIVRRVYNKASAPVIGGLYPVIDGEEEYLIFIELAFMEDLREYEFPSLPVDPDPENKQAPTDDQLAAVDALIDDMDMTTADGDAEDMISPGSMTNPTLQRLFQVLSARAMDENCAIPELTQSLKEAIDYCPVSLRKETEEKLKSLFPLERIAKEKNAGDNVYKQSGVVGASKADDISTTGASLTDMKGNNVTSVGFTDPVGDFNTMLSSESLRDKAYSELGAVILQLITESVGDSLFAKAMNAITQMRTVTVMTQQAYAPAFNDFMISLKSMVHNKQQMEFWEHFVKAGVTLIDSSECSTSTVTSSEKEGYLKAETVTSLETDAPAGDDDDDMLDLL